MNSAIKGGKLYSDVNFVPSKEDADIEIMYDKIKHNKKDGTLLYFYHNRLVATALLQKEKGE